MSWMSWLDGVSPLTPGCTPGDSWSSFLVGVSPAVSALLSAIALWVASRARSTYKDEQRILSDLVISTQRSSGQPEARGSRRAAPGRRKS